MAGMLLAACGGGTRSALDDRRPGGRLARSLVAPATTTTLSVPVTPDQPATRPVYNVHDYNPDAPPNAVALTIDDGPDMPYTEEILSILAGNGVKATFSMIGVEVQRFPSLAREVVSEGHAVCNHSLTHPEPFATLSPVETETQILGGLELIHDVTGATPGVFRSPGGDWSQVVFDQLAQAGQVPVDWNVDTRDWTRPGTGYVESRLLGAQPGDIVLCHDGGGDRSETVDALRSALPALRARGVAFVTL